MIREYGDKDTSIVLLQMVDDHDLEGLDTEIEEIKRSIGKEFCLATIKVRDWNKDLSPWNAPAVFGKEDIGDGAKDTLKEVSICRKYTKVGKPMQTLSSVSYEYRKVKIKDSDLSL